MFKLNRVLLKIPYCDIFNNQNICLLGCGSSIDKYDINFNGYDLIVGTNRIYQTSFMKYVNVIYYNMSSVNNIHLFFEAIKANPNYKYTVFCPWSSGPKRRAVLDQQIKQYEIDDSQHVYSKGITRKLNILPRPLTGVAALNHLLFCGAKSVDVYGFDFYTESYTHSLKRFKKHNKYHDLSVNKKFFLDLIAQNPYKINWHK